MLEVRVAGLGKPNIIISSWLFTVSPEKCLKQVTTASFHIFPMLLTTSSYGTELRSQESVIKLHDNKQAGNNRCPT
jgi:hypothetical protein